MTSNALRLTAALDEPATLAAIADLHEVIDALYRFAAGQDERDRELFESAFAPGATVDFTEPARRFGVSIPVFVGRTEIADTIMGTTAGLDTTHTVTNPRIRIQQDRATLSALVEAQHLPKHDPSRHLLLKNRYSVDLSREGRRWVIERMRIENVWFTGDPGVLFAQDQ
jgi:hypothetical protein